MIRRWVGSVALVAAVGICLAQGHADAFSARTPPQEVSASELGSADADVEVFTRLDASVEEAAGVRQKIEHAASVIRFAYVNQRAAYRELEKTLRDQPDKLAVIHPNTLRPSFRLLLHNTSQSFGVVDQMKRLPGVDEVISHAADELYERCSAPADVGVFMNVDATDEQTAAVLAALQGDPSVVAVRSIGKKKALKIFRCLYADQPDLAESVDASALPTSFEVTTREGEDLGAMKERAELHAGVDEALIRGRNRP